MRQIVYDVETFCNFFCVAFQDFKSDKKWFFQISEWQDDTEQIRNFIRSSSIVLIGYNNLFFDNIVLNYILSRSRTAEEIYNVSQIIINGQKDKATDSLKKSYNNLMKSYKYNNDYKSIDLMRLKASKALRVSLKQMQVSMKWPRVQDLPKHHSELVSKEEIDIIRDYNFNDTGSTKELCKKLGDDIDLRIRIQKEFGLNCLSKDGVKTGVDLFAKLYEEEIGNKDFLQGRTYRSNINLGECISDKVKFNSSQFNNLLDTLQNKIITKTKGALDYSVMYGGIKHVYGTGGIHSKDAPGIYVPKKGELFMDADVSSLYPSLLIVLRACPKHLDPNIFIPIYESKRDERVNIWKPKSKKSVIARLMADTYKLMLNGTYGNLINEYSWLYDPKAAMTITLNGQLYLSMLSERLIDAGFRVDSLNTDGVTCFVPKDRSEEYYSICKEWELHTELELEFAQYHKVIRRDVNCYYAIYGDSNGDLLLKNGKQIIKEKGAFIREPLLGKGYDKPIIKEALYQYFIYGKSIEETIYKHDDIYDFCMMQKMGSNFKAVHNGKVLQKTNRYYAAKGQAAGYLYKVDGPKKSHVLKDSGVLIFNDFVDKKVEGDVPLKNYNINYDYYIREARGIQKTIEPDQLCLF